MSQNNGLNGGGRYPLYFFIVVFLLILYLFFDLFSPFIFDFLWATILVVILYPLYERLLKITGDRKTISSLLMCFFIVIIIIVPFVIIIITLTKESVELYSTINTKLSTLTFPTIKRFLSSEIVEKINKLTSPFFKMTPESFEKGVVGVLKNMSAFLVSLTKTIFKGFATSFMHFFFFLIATYYFFKYGDSLLKEVLKLSPLAYDREEKIIKKFKEVAQATVIGNISTALIQGILGGIGFVIVGISSPVLWGTVMAFMSLVPILGTFIVWIPATIYLLIVGSYGKAIFLLIWGSTVVGLSDNFIKPLIIQGKTNLHSIIIFFSILGGIKLFGFSGIVLGPIITSLTFVFFEIYKEEFSNLLPGTVKLKKDEIEKVLEEK